MGVSEYMCNTREEKIVGMHGTFNVDFDNKEKLNIIS